MSANPVQAAAPAALTHLEAVETFYEPEVVKELQRRLDTERSAGKALKAAVRDLESRLQESRAAEGSQRDRNIELYNQLALVNNELMRVLEQPRWRRLLQR
jgi:hypothetical protein